MRATLIQLVGLAVFVGSVAAVSLLAGGAALGAVLVYVGLAMERD